MLTLFQFRLIIGSVRYNIKPLCYCAYRYIALQGTRQESVPQVKLGKTLNLRVFGVCF